MSSGLALCLFSNQSTVEASEYSYTQSIRDVQYNWGYGSPDKTVPNDYFTALFDQSGFFSAGDYFIQTLADDGVKVEADGKWLINRWSPSGGQLNRSLWLNVNEGLHTVKTHYFEERGQAVLFSHIIPFDHWLAYYYPNQNLQGTPVASKVISPSGELKRLSENHGLESPVAGVPKDGFSAKYSTVKRLPAGEYVLRAKADDGVRVYIDGKLVLNHWKPNDFRTEDAVKVMVENRTNVPDHEKDTHTIEVEYFEGSGNSAIDFFIEPFQAYGDNNGWIGEIYPNMSLSGTPIILGGKNSANPTSSLNFDWGWNSAHPLSPKEQFSARFTKEEHFDSGYYTFQAASDDGVRIWVNDKLVINSWKNSDGTLKQGKVLLEEGYHKVRVEYFDNTQRASLKVSYFPSANSSYQVKARQINENWGSGSPNSLIARDQFTAMVDQSGSYSQGDYFIQTLADDGIRVEADGKWVINRWTPSSGAINKALWLGVNAGEHTVKTHYYEDSGNAVLFSNVVPFDSWLAYYYPNSYLQGTPTAGKIIQPSGDIKRLTQNHGLNSPAAGIPKDHFSAKYTTAKRLAAGDYILRVRADDGVRVYLDGQLVVNNWKANDGKTEDAIKISVKDRVNVPVSEKDIHWIEVEYYDGSGNSFLDVFVEPYQTAIGSTGWIGEVYPNQTFSGNPVILGGKNSSKPIENLDFSWGSGSPHPSITTDRFSAVFKQNIQIASAGEYQFFLQADEGAQLFVNGTLLIDSWQGGAGQLKQNIISLASGNHTVEVRYYENTGNASVKAGYEKVGNRHFTQVGGDVHYNWGLGSPSTDLPNDNFTALFDQSKVFSAGNYFIQTLADDGVKVEVNGNFLINRWSDADGSIDRALWLNVPSANQSVKTHYYEKTGNAAIFSDIVPINSWIAYYYPNKSLSGLPVAAKVIPSTTGSFQELNGTASPVPGKVNADQFSARYSSAVKIPAGEYILRTKADDGVKVFVDGKLVLDRWTDGSVREDAVLVNVADHTNVTTEQKDIHWIEVHYYEGAGDSTVSFTFEPFSSNHYLNEWIGFVYPNKSLTGIPTVIGGKNATTKISQLKLDWQGQSPSPMIPVDGFSAKFKYNGYFTKGAYVLEGHFDDGAKIWVDGKLLMDAWYNTGAYGTKTTTRISLEEGYHEIVVDYYENIGNAYVKLDIKEDTVYRVPERPAPYGPDYYDVKNGILYHYLGVPGNTTATIYIGPAPSFLTSGNVYVKDANDKFYLRTDVTDVYVGTYLPPYKGLDLRLPSQVTAARIDSYIKAIVPESPLIGYGQAFINAEAKYGVNALYLVAHSLVESNWGRSKIATEKHNLFGFGAYDSCPFECAYYFPSFNESIEYVAWYVRANYLNSDGRWYGGAPNLKGMNVRYATDMDWAEKISGLMHRIHAYNASEYANVNILPSNPESPPTPGRDIPGSTLLVYPDGIDGVTINGVNFRSQPSTESTTTIIRTLTAKTGMKVLGDNQNGWYKVNIDGQEGWIHKDYVSVKNLLQVVNLDPGYTLRIRTSPNGEIIGQLQPSTFLKAVLDVNGNYTKDSTNSWYQIHIPSTTNTGWVGGAYIAEVGRK